jgi:hypothetical protein
VPEASVAWDESSDDFKAWTETDAAGRFTLCGLPVNRQLFIYGSRLYADRVFRQGWLNVAPGGDATIEVILE